MLGPVPSAHGQPGPSRERQLRSLAETIGARTCPVARTFRAGRPSKEGAEGAKSNRRASDRAGPRKRRCLERPVTTGSSGLPSSCGFSGFDGTDLMVVARGLRLAEDTRTDPRDLGIGASSGSERLNEWACNLSTASGDEYFDTVQRIVRLRYQTLRYIGGKPVCLQYTMPHQVKREKFSTHGRRALDDERGDTGLCVIGLPSAGAGARVLAPKGCQGSFFGSLSPTTPSVMESVQNRYLTLPFLARLSSNRALGWILTAQRTSFRESCQELDLSGLPLLRNADDPPAGKCNSLRHSWQRFQPFHGIAGGD